MYQLAVNNELVIGSPVASDITGADNDREIYSMFLQRAGVRSKETARRYERELTRFCYWLYSVAGLSFKSVKLKHMQQYVSHIQNLPIHWLNAGLISAMPERVLFKSSIKPGKSTDQVIDVLSAFFSFLNKNNYISGNPASSLVRSGETVARGSNTIRFFYRDEWEHLKDCLCTIPCEAERQRTRYIITLGYSLALRESELTEHNCGNIHRNDRGGYYLEVLGKGNKIRQIPVNKQILSELESYHQFTGAETMERTYPLAPKLPVKYQRIPVSLSPRGLRFWWKRLMKHCADNAATDTAEKFLSMPFHALRHTALTHLADCMDIEDLAIFAGHNSIQTTSKYYHAESEKLERLTANHSL